MSGLQWVVDGYTLVFAALMLSAGAVSDRIGARQRWPYRLGSHRTYRALNGGGDPPTRWLSWGTGPADVLGPSGMRLLPLHLHFQLASAFGEGAQDAFGGLRGRHLALSDLLFQCGCH